MLKISRDFYRQNDVVATSRDLLGKVLCSHIEGATCKAVITETEAYAGVGDRASHAFGDRRTPRTAPMYRPGGTAYVYLCYGIHHLFNVVVGEAGIPLAILIRAALPLENVDTMRKRRGKLAGAAIDLTGPGVLSQAMGITTRLTGASLLDDEVWLEDHRFRIDPADIVIGPRVGVGYAGADALRPYRFRVDGRRLRAAMF